MNGVVDDTAAELLTAARMLDPTQGPTAVVTGYGPELDAVCENLRGSYGEIWKISAESLADPNAELMRQALVRVLPAQCILLVAHNHFGVDLSPGLSVKMKAAYVPDVVGIQGVNGLFLNLIRQEFGGQVSTHVRCDSSSGAVINIRPGTFQAAPNAGVDSVIAEKPIGGALTSRRRYIETIAAETGAVDICKQSVLVSIGRGIQEADNVGLAEDLAEALGAAVSCSRPVVDAKWLEKSRQVGSSGKTVKPKVYLACGISGSFQHMAGIKGNPFIVAVNKNAKAPIFRVANVGIVDDVLEFMPALASGVREQSVLSHGGTHDRK
jgi:electron transfer flavoprotein alpha subunit